MRCEVLEPRPGADGRMDCRAKGSLRLGDWGIGGLGVRKAFLDPMPRKICELRGLRITSKWSLAAGRP